MFIVFSRPPRAAIVRLFVACDISKGSTHRQQSLTTQTTLRPSCRLDKMPRLASPRQVGGRLFDFSVSLRSFGMPRAELTTYFNRLAIAPREAFKPREAGIVVLDCFVNLVAFHNGRADGIRIVVHTSEDDGTSGGGGEFAGGPITACYVAVFVLVGGF